MGADGGTIPKRCELVKNKKKKEKVSKDMVNLSRWRNCQLSQQPLKKPIVACRLGRLYNKEAVLDALLKKTISEFENAKHIRGLKDIKELKLTNNKDYIEGQSDKGDIYKDYNVAPFICSVSNMPMNGNYPFMVNWNCGCVVSEKAINEIKLDVCHGCSGPSTSDKLVSLYPSEELLETYKTKLLEERTKKKRKAEVESGETLNPKKADVKIGKLKREAPNSIQNNGKASAAYKSLFTTCEAAKRKPTPHWITYNPLFY